MSDALSPDEITALEDIGGTAMGAGSTTLSILLNQQVGITSPTAQVFPPDRIYQLLHEPSVLVEVPINVGTRIANAFFFGQADTARITDLMMGGEGSPPDTVIDELRLSAISEAVNQMMGMAANAMASSYGRKVEVSPPQATVIDRPEELVLPPAFGSGPYVVITYLFSIEGLVESQIFQLLAGEGAKELVNAMKAKAAPPPIPAAPPPPPPQAEPDNPGMSASIPSAQGMPPGMQGGMPQGYPQGGPQGYPQQGYPQQGMDPAAWGGQMPMGQQMMPQQMMAPPRDQPMAQPVQFGPLGMQMPGMPAAQSGLDLIMDVPLKVTVELGRTRMQIRDVLELGKGSVVELDKLAGEPVDLLVNGKLIARGEVVVIDENFGIRVTDIVSPAERVSGFRGIGL